MGNILLFCCVIRWYLRKSLINTSVKTVKTKMCLTCHKHFIIFSGSTRTTLTPEKWLQRANSCCDREVAERDHPPVVKGIHN